MFQELPVNEKSLYAFKATGRLSEQDYQEFIPRIESLLETESPLSLYIELDQVSAWALTAVWEDFKFGLSHQKDFEKIAIVGDNRWQQLMTVLGNAFTEAEIRYFSHSQTHQAWDWLKQQASDEEQSPVLEAKAYQRILVATDFSAHSEIALQRAQQLAVQYGSKLSLLHTLEPVSYPASDLDTMLIEPYVDAQAEQILFDRALEKLKTAAETLNGNLSVSCDVIWSRAKSGILSYAAAQSVDLIVLGSHGHGAIDRLLGSTASGVVNAARCDVLVIKLPE